MHSSGRARLAALVLATGAVLIAGSGTAGATEARKSVFTATGGSSVLRLVVNLPVAAPGVGSQIRQDLALTGSNIRTSGVSSPARGISQATLGAGGNLPAALQLSVVNEYGKPQQPGRNAFPPGLPLTGELLALDASVRNPDADGVAARAVSKVAGLRLAGGANLQAVLDAVLAQVATALDGVIGTRPDGAPAGDVAGVTTSVTDLLGSVVDQLNAASAGAAQPVADAVNQVVAALQALPQQLAAKLRAATAGSSLPSVAALQAEQSVSRSAGSITSTSTSKLTDIGLLGDLITVSGLSSSATATLGERVSSAAPKAVGDSSLLKVHLADLLTVDVTGDLDTALAAAALPPAVRTAVNTALANITAALNDALGATLTGPSVGKRVANRNEASVVVNAAQLTVQPVGFAKPLLQLSLVPTAASVVKDVESQAVQPLSTAPVLAHTGTDLHSTWAFGTVLIALAFLLRRRRLALG